MNAFDSRGHLTDDALQALSLDRLLPELERLEIAEHLAFCDECLTRSLSFLPEEALALPARSCRDTLWRRVRRRNLRELSGRFATAAAAIAIAAGLWGFNVFGGLVSGSAALSDSALLAVRRADFSRQAEQLDRAFGKNLERLNQLFEFRGGAANQTDPSQSQGGLFS